MHKIMFSHMNNPMAGQTKNVQNLKLLVILKFIHKTQKLSDDL